MGRPVTEATTAARVRHYQALQMARKLGIDLDALLATPHQSVEDIICLLTRYGRELYRAGRTYNQYAESINSRGSKPLHSGESYNMGDKPTTSMGLRGMLG